MLVRELPRILREYDTRQVAAPGDLTCARGGTPGA
jgi:hypothetical protein